MPRGTTMGELTRREASARVDLARRLLRLARQLDPIDQRGAATVREAAAVVRDTVPADAVTDDSPVQLWDPRADGLL